MSTAKNEFYPVKRPFDYGEEHYEQGDRWRPQGHRWDEKIITSGLVGKRRAGDGADSVDALVNEHTRNELRAMCKERGLAIYGTKDELASRLIEGE